jgi:diacylglycerol kinase (ATP)
MRWLAIANPAAGRAQEADRALARLDGIAHEAVRTTAPGDATRLVRAAAGFDGIIAIGGDGTVAAVLRGMDLGRQQLAVLPAGHGNCLARDLGVADPRVALAAIERSLTRPLDLMDARIGSSDGREERRLCASTLAIGYVADVVDFGRRRLHGFGRAAYALAALGVIPVWFEATVQGSGSGAERYTGIVVNNTAHLANFRGFPAASVRDGRLDVMELACGWTRQLLHDVSVLAGSEAFGPRRMRQATSERIALAHPATLMADGELLANVSSLEVTCRPAAVECVVAQG